MVGSPHQADLDPEDQGHAWAPGDLCCYKPFFMPHPEQGTHLRAKPFSHISPHPMSLLAFPKCTGGSWRAWAMFLCMTQHLNMLHLVGPL